jgi:heme exporter protein A
VLAVAGLAVARGGVRLLEGISFALAPGAVLVLRGPNGSGKTTLLRTLAGLQPPAAGRVELAPDTLAYGGHLDALKPTLTAAETLSFWAGVFGTGAAAVGRALAAFDLVPLADRQAQHLSAGQRRRLGLARLIVAERPVWALDEPTVSLDAGAVAGFGRVLRAHLADGGVAIIATHADLGLPEAALLDLPPYRVRRPPEAFGGADAAAFA